MPTEITNFMTSPTMIYLVVGLIFLVVVVYYVRKFLIAFNSEPLSLYETTRKYKLTDGLFPYSVEGVGQLDSIWELIKFYLVMIALVIPFNERMPEPILGYAQQLKSLCYQLALWVYMQFYQVPFVGAFLKLLGAIWLSRFAIFGMIITLYLPSYLMTVIKRQRLYERQVIKNDWASIRLKNKILKHYKFSDKAEKVENEKKVIVNKKNEGANKQSSDIADREKLKEIGIRKGALEHIKATEITYNTREKQIGRKHIVHRMITVRFIPPSDLDELKEYDKLKDELKMSIETVVGQRFSAEFQDKETVNSTAYIQAIIEEWDNEYYYDDEIKRLTELKELSNYQHSYPYKPTTVKGKKYEGIRDKTDENEVRKQLAGEWADAYRYNVQTVLQQNDYQSIVYKKTEIKSKTAELIFTLPKDFKGNKKTDMKVIESAIKQEVGLVFNPSIKVTIDSIIVSLPLPNGKDGNGQEIDENFIQMLDVEERNRRNFG